MSVMRNLLFAVVSLLLPVEAFACCPYVWPEMIAVSVGETVVLRSGATPGFTLMPQFVTFTTLTPDIIAVDGKIDGGFSGQVRVTGLAPGIGQISYAMGGMLSKQVIGTVQVLDCDLRVSLPYLVEHAIVQRPVTLKAEIETQEPVDIQWFGALPDRPGFAPIYGATSSEYTFTPTRPGAAVLLVRVSTSCGIIEREVTVVTQSAPSRRRAVK